METRLGDRKLLTRLCFIFCAVLGVVLVYRWQRIFFLMCTDGIISDMPAHIRLALAHNDYGLSSYIVRALYSLGDEHFAQTALSLCLAGNQVLSVFTLVLLLKKLFPGLESCAALLASLLAHICGPWIIPGVQTEMYLGAYNGNVLHNMTMLFSRSFIPLVFLFFFDCWDARRGKIALLPWLGAALSFLISTLFKPNFAFAFIPLLAVLLLVDLIKYRGRYLKQDIILGLIAVPAGLACIWQYLVLFASDFAGTSSSVALRTYTLSSLASALLMYLRGLLLPIYVFTVCLKDGPRGTKHEDPAAERETEQGKLEKEHLLLIISCAAVAILEALVFTETGYRANDGNFEWGSLGICGLIWGTSLTLLSRHKTPRRLCIALPLLLGHLVTGVYCLYQARTGGYYWFYF